MKSTLVTSIKAARRSTDGAFHLELDQPVHLDGVLERELLGDRLDEARDDHRGGLLLGEPAAHQVEELLVADLGDGRLVADVDRILLDVDVDRKSTRLNSSHMSISYAVFCLKKKKIIS